MTYTPALTFFHSPNTRSTGTLTLLRELGAEYLERHFLGTLQGHQAVFQTRGDVENVLVYRADLYPEAGLAPKIGDPLRGPYLRWMAFYGSSFEPAVVDRAQKREPAPQAMSPYGDFDTMFKTLTDQLARGPYLLGDKFTALDVLWGTALTWITLYQLVPAEPVIQAYIDRVNARPAVAWAKAKDAELAAAQGS